MLLLADPIDAFWPDRLDGFEGKQLRSVTQASAESRQGRRSAGHLAAARRRLKKALGDEVADVRATGRLTDSAVVLAAGDKGPDLQMQRLLRRAGRAMMPARAGAGGQSAAQADRGAGRRSWQMKRMIAEAAGTLLDLARVQEGDLPRDPAQFARRVTSLLGSSFGLVFDAWPACHDIGPADDACRSAVT